MSEHKEDADALGTAAFVMMIELLRRLRDKKVITIQEGLQILGRSFQSPMMPGNSPPFALTPHAKARLEGEIGSWAEMQKRAGH